MFILITNLSVHRDSIWFWERQIADLTPKSDEICRNYLKGRCMWGRQCHRQHPPRPNREASSDSPGPGVLDQLVRSSNLPNHLAKLIRLLLGTGDRGQIVPPQQMRFVGTMRRAGANWDAVVAGAIPHRRIPREPAKIFPWDAVTRMSVADECIYQ
jgi:hypothetical protein